MKSVVATALGLLSALCLLEWSVVSGCNERDRLVRDLTQNYLKIVEPDDVVLKIQISFICSRFDEAKAELISNVWEQLTWKDKRVSWTPKEYGGIENIRLPSHLLWRPDVKLYNSLSPVDERDQTNVVVLADGTVIWVPSAIYRSSCSKGADDAFNCEIKVGSWTYDADTVKLELTDAGVSLENYLNSTCPLTAESASAAIHTKTYPCCPEPYSHIQIDLNLKPKQD